MKSDKVCIECQQIEQPLCEQPFKEITKIIHRLNNFFSLTFPDFNKNYTKFPDYSRFSLTFRKTWPIFQVFQVQYEP